MGQKPFLLGLSPPEFTALVSDYLNGLRKDWSCSVCGSEEMAVSRTVDGEDQFTAIAGKPFDDEIKAVLYMYLLRCEKCGNTYFLNYGPLDDWARREGRIGAQEK